MTRWCVPPTALARAALLFAGAMVGCGARTQLVSPCWVTLEGRETNVIFVAEQGNAVWLTQIPTLATREAEFMNVVVSAVEPTQRVGGFVHPVPGFGHGTSCERTLPIQTPVQPGGASLFYQELLTRSVRPDTEGCGCQQASMQRATQLVTDPTREYLIVPMVAVPNCSEPSEQFLSTFLRNPRFTVAIVRVDVTTEDWGNPPWLMNWGNRTENANTEQNRGYFWVMEPQVFAAQLRRRIERNRRCALQLPDTVPARNIREVRVSAEDGSVRAVERDVATGWSITELPSLRLNGASCDWAVEHRATTSVHATTCPTP